MSGKLFRLESSVNEKFIQLLTIDQDATRQYRVEGDQFCRMLDQILNKQRNIRLDGTECNWNNSLYLQRNSDWKFIVVSSYHQLK